MHPSIFSTPRFGDDRGWFTESYSRRSVAKLGIECDFVQDNHSYSASRFTLRGLHYQTPPFSQAKLVRCIRGSIFDVLVDVRTGSPTRGKWDARVLSAGNGLQMFVPDGYAHGFLTLEDNCEVMYKASAFYAPDHDAVIARNDPEIGIDWPLDGALPELSDKDRALPSLARAAVPFAYDGISFEGLPECQTITA